MADFVNNGNKLEGRDDLKKLVEHANYDTDTVTMSTDTTIYLMNDLDMGARQNNGIKVNGSNWTPIGINNSKKLIAEFNGNGHKISGIYVDEIYFSGVFGSIDSKISNLTIKDSYIKAKEGAGGIAALSSNKIYNCHNKNTSVIGERFIGGIAGNSVNSIEKCSNDGLILATKSNVGGISGIVSKRKY